MHWRPRNFRRHLDASGLNAVGLHYELLRKLGSDAPARSTIYYWTEDDSKGPSLDLWTRALCKVLGCERRDLFKPRRRR